jgi:molybdate transport system ATP-binding protein
VSFSIAVHHRQGDFTLDVAVETETRVVALFGPSGSGKSTLLHLMAGLVRPQAGRIILDGRILVDVAAGLFVPSHRRRIGYVFQDARLFPHLTVEQNLSYGRWFSSRKNRFAEPREIVELLGIGHLLRRRPATLSGGEKQRVAIGRAILASPRVLLMDEPLASLDAARKAETLPYIERLRDELSIPIVYVSHSAEEVGRLTENIVFLDHGKVARLEGALKTAAPIPILPR